MAPASACQAGGGGGIVADSLECTDMLKLRPFQRKFLAQALAPDIDTAALSIPRGNGKSALAGDLVARILDPGDKLFRPGTESVLCAASLKQARIVYRFARDELEPRGGYTFVDSANRISITHTATRTRLDLIGSNGKTAMGLVNCPWAICDEPGAWEVNGGTLLYDAIETAKGKPGSPLKAVYIGTLAPSTGGWWHDLVHKGSRGSTYVQALQGDPKKWDQWAEIQRVNPLVNLPGKDGVRLRKKLLEERDDARRDSRLKARFLSYRLNVPSGDESTVLLTVDDWQRVCKRPGALPAGKPIVGLDLGGSRAWSAAVALWKSGRIEAVAITPGIPSIAEQERRDNVPAGVYQRLVDAGILRVSTGLRVPPPSDLITAIMEEWGRPEIIVCDRFRINELRDCAGYLPVSPRMCRWSEASADIRDLRRMAKDGPLSCPPSARALITASLSGALVKNDDQGSVRLVKKGTNNQARDDVAAALVLAAGAAGRAMKRPTRKRRVLAAA